MKRIFNQWFGTKTRFETEAKGNSEMAYCIVQCRCDWTGFSKFSSSSSQLSQSQVQVKLEPPEDGPIVALNGDSEPGDDHYDSTGVNGDSFMETGVSVDEVRQW